jgi:DNA-binding XRE family transcriptional regulator
LASDPCHQLAALRSTDPIHLSSALLLIVCGPIVCTVHNFRMTKSRTGIARTLSVNVKKFRLQRHWSQEVLAEESGLHRTYVSGIEREARNPTIMIVDRLAKALGVRPSDLLREVNG